MKAYTDLEQSKKLAEILPLESADIVWVYSAFEDNYFPNFRGFGKIVTGAKDIKAWSLSALLELIPPYLGKFNDGIDFGFSKSMNGKWYSAHYIQLDNSGLATFTKTVTGNTSVDAAFEMIVWLKENGHI